MDYREAGPSSPFAKFIKCFWSIDYKKQGGVSTPEPVLPDGCPEIVFNLSDRFLRLRSGDETVQPSTILAGQMTKRVLIRPSGHVSLFGVRFTPAGAFQLLRFPVSEITNEIVELSAVAGVRGRQIEEMINEASSFEARVAVFEKAFRQSLSKEIDRVALTASEMIERNGGRLPVSLLTRELGLSERRLERSFKRSVGVSPKTLSRIVRFQSAIRAFQNGTSPNMLDAALEFGYYDQSHLIHDFKSFSDTTPLAYFEQSHSISDVFTGAS
jgi:AraC-like DNA-binding protein